MSNPSLLPRLLWAAAAISLLTAIAVAGVSSAFMQRWIVGHLQAQLEHESIQTAKNIELRFHAALMQLDTLAASSGLSTLILEGRPLQDRNEFIAKVDDPILHSRLSLFVNRPLGPDPYQLASVWEHGQMLAVLRKEPLEWTVLIARPVHLSSRSGPAAVLQLEIPMQYLLVQDFDAVQHAIVTEQGQRLVGTIVANTVEIRTPLNLAWPLDQLHLSLVSSVSMDSAWQELFALFRLQIAIVILLLAGVLTACYIVARRLMHPLVHLGEAAQHITRTGQLQQRLPTQTGFAEYQRLARVFNAMMDRLQATQEAQEYKIQQRTVILRERESSLRRQFEVSDLITESQAQKIANVPLPVLLHQLLQRLLPLLESEVGLIAEVRDNPQGQPVLCHYALASTATRDHARYLYGEQYQPQTGFLSLDEALQRVIVQGRPIVSNLPALPPADALNEPKLSNFLGLPLAVGGKVLGVLGLANREGGYESHHIDLLEPLLASLAGIIDACHADQARERAEHALSASEQRLELAVRGATIGLWEWDVLHDRMAINHLWAGMLGYEVKELDPLNLTRWCALCHPDDALVVRSLLHAHLDGHAPDFESEVRMRHRDGRWLWILASGKVSERDGNGRALRISGTHLNITERRMAELRLQERTKQLQAIFRMSPDGFVSFDSQGVLRYVSPTFERLTGLSETILIGLSPAQFDAALQDRCAPEAPYRGLASLRARLNSAGDGPREGRENRELFELRWPRKAIIEVGISESSNDSVNVLLYFRDVTAEVEVERLKSEFLSTAAHELRTPMASVYGFAELLLNNDFDQQTQRDLLTTIYEQSGLLVQIINELLDLARIEARRGKDFRLQTLSLNELLCDTVNGLKMPGDDRSVVVSLPSQPVLVHADGGKLRQAFNNVLSNAYKYSPNGGEIRLVLSAEVAEQPHLCAIQVSDQGIGMSSEQLARVFERFYRADSSGKIPGTGLGMSVVKEIIELHGGYVTVDSRFGAGTTVTVYLPLIGETK